MDPDSPLREGDELVAASGRRYVVGPQVAYRGKDGCTSPMCTQIGDPDRCYGWHCSTCHERVSMMGHDCPEAS